MFYLLRLYIIALLETQYLSVNNMGYITLLLFIVPGVLGYKTGPPVADYASLCTDMVPTGHNGGVSLATDTATPPYTITTSADKYTAGGSLTGM